MLVQSPLRNRIRAQVAELRGETFQDFITLLHYKAHGPVRFMSLRDKKDAGCDGIIVDEQCLIACYGPENAKFPAQKRKISGDYASYVATWKARLPNWRLCINLEPSPEHLKLGAELHGSDSVVWGRKRFLALIDELSFGHVRDLCRSLLIDDDEVGRDFLQYILDGLLRLPKTAGSVEYGPAAPELERKIRENFPADSVDHALRLYELTTEEQMAVAEAIGLLDDKDTKTLKVRLLTDFSRVGGALFEEKFNALAREYGQRYNKGQDDEVLGYVAALLWHVFGQCLIGREPPPLATGA